MLCITGFILGLLSIFIYWLIPFLPLLAIVFSGVGLSKVKVDNTKGKGLATWGIALGSLYTLQVGIKLVIAQGLY